MKLSLLDSSYWEIGQLQGELVNLSVTVSASSDIRRVSSMTLHMGSAEQLSTDYLSAWVERMVRLYYGIYNPDTDEIRYWLLGSFLFTSTSYTIDALNHQMSLSIADMMAAATQERGSQIGYGIKYPAGSSIANSLKATVARFSPYKKYDICEFEDTVPYDIEPTMGSYPIDAMKSLVGLFPWYEQFYSRDGVYTVRKIPTTMSAGVVMTANELAQVVISEKGGDVSYSTIKNCTEIWGKEIDANYTAVACSSSNGLYTLTIHSTYKTYESGALIAFTPNVNSVAGQKLRVSGLDAYDIVVEQGDGAWRNLKTDELIADTLYVVKYFDKKFILQGEALIHVMCMEYNKRPSDSEILGLKAFHGCENIRFVINPESQFACDRIGVVKQVMSDGDYANIYTTELAYERAKYDNWKASRLQESIQIQTLFVPWLDVNEKVEYTSLATGLTNQYLIQQIEVSPYTGIMTITMVRFYPLYPWTDGTLEPDVPNAALLLDETGNVLTDESDYALSWIE